MSLARMQLKVDFQPQASDTEAFRCFYRSLVFVIAVLVTCISLRRITSVFSVTNLWTVTENHLRDLSKYIYH